MHCGMCLPTCPTYDTTKRERNSPRGRIALMRAIADDELVVTKTFADEMSYCLGCLACQTACPAGINDAPGRNFWRSLTLRFLFQKPRAMRLVGALTRIYQRSGLEYVVRTFGLTMFLPGTLRRLEPQTPRMASAFSNRLIAPSELPRGEARHRVALLT